MIQLEEIIFNEKTKKESVILTAYYYIKQLHDEGLLSDKEIHEIKQKYHIDIE